MRVGRIIDGKAFAAKLREQVATGVQTFTAQAGRKPGLAVVLVGEDPASGVYVRNKGKATVEVGMESMEFRRPATIGQDELLELVEELNGDDNVDDKLVQLTLPEHIDEKGVICAIDKGKALARERVCEIVSGVQTCALPIWAESPDSRWCWWVRIRPAASMFGTRARRLSRWAWKAWNSAAQRQSARMNCWNWSRN